MMRRTVLLIAADGSKRCYPLPDDVSLRETYTFDGKQYRVVLVITEGAATFHAVAGR